MTIDSLSAKRLETLLDKASTLDDDELTKWISQQKDSDALGKALLDLMRPK